VAQAGYDGEVAGSAPKLKLPGLRVHAAEEHSRLRRAIEERSRNRAGFDPRMSRGLE
jgi:hypothetical protein